MSSSSNFDPRSPIAPRLGNIALPPTTEVVNAQVSPVLDRFRLWEVSRDPTFLKELLGGDWYTPACSWGASIHIALRTGEHLITIEPVKGPITVGDTFMNVYGVFRSQETACTILWCDLEVRAVHVRAA